MKYAPEDYIDCGFYSDMDSDVQNHTERLVKCRKPHVCPACQREIPKGAYALLERGFLDGKPVESHTCTDCLDKWLDEIRRSNDE